MLPLGRFLSSFGEVFGKFGGFLGGSKCQKTSFKTENVKKTNLLRKPSKKAGAVSKHVFVPLMFWLGATRRRAAAFQA